VKLLGFKQTIQKKNLYTSSYGKLVVGKENGDDKTVSALAPGFTLCAAGNGDFGSRVGLKQYSYSSSSLSSFVDSSVDSSFSS
jgi:hypothetical protein